MKIAIGTLVRDAELNIPKYQNFLNGLKKEIDCNIFIFENDSVDSTKKLLKGITPYILSEDLGLKKFEDSPATIERATQMAYLRNRLKDFIFSIYNYDIVIFTDIDLISWPDPKIIKQNIERIDNEPRLGAITSNGLSLYGTQMIYYDIWSLVIGRKIQNHRIWSPWDDTLTEEVDSAFGGLAIYSGPAIKYIKYEAIHLEGYGCPWHEILRSSCEHCGLNLQIRDQNLKILIDKTQILYR